MDFDYGDAAQKIADQQTNAVSSNNTPTSQPSTPSASTSVPYDYSKSAQDIADKSGADSYDYSKAAQAIADQQDQAFTKAALDITAKDGSLKKDDPDTYKQIVNQKALDPNYDPVSAAATDQSNKQNTRDFNKDIYDARNISGIKTSVPLSDQAYSVLANLPQATENLYHSVLNPEMFGRILEANYQNAPSIATIPISLPLATMGVNLPQLPSISGRTANENAADIESALDVQKDRAKKLIDDVGDWLGKNYVAMTPQQQNEHFDSKVKDEFDIDQATKGQGFLKNFGDANSGTKVSSPDTINKMSDLMFTDPTQLGLMKAAPFLGAGAKFLGKAGAEGFANVASKVADAVPQGVQDFASDIGGSLPPNLKSGIGTVLQGIGVPNQVSEGIGKLLKTKAGGPLMAGLTAGGAAAIKNYDDPVEALKSFIKVGAWGAGVSYASELAGTAGDILKGEFPEGAVKPIPIKLAEGAINLAKSGANSSVAKNALGGALFSIPLALSEEDPNKRMGIVANSIANGALMTPVEYLSTILDARYAANTNAKFYKGIPTTSPDYGTANDAAHNEAMASLPKETQDSVNRARNLMGPGGELYALNDDDFQNKTKGPLIQNLISQGHTPEEAQTMAENLNPGGISYGSSPEGKPQIFMKASMLSPDSIHHEVGHFISGTIMDDVNAAKQQASDLQAQGQPIPQDVQDKIDLGNKLESSIPTGKQRIEEGRKYADQLYDYAGLQRQINTVTDQIKSGQTELQPKLDNLNNLMDHYKQSREAGLDDETFKNEWLADQFSLYARGLESGKTPGLHDTIKMAVGSFLDKIAPQAITQYMGTRQTPIGFRPSFIAADVFDDWLGDRIKSAQEQAATTPIPPNQNPQTVPMPPELAPKPEPTQEQLQATVKDAPVQPQGAQMPQVDPQIIKDASDTLFALQIPKKQALARVMAAVESLGAQGADLSKISLKDVIAESLKDKGQQVTTQTRPAPAPVAPIQGIPDTPKPVITPDMPLGEALAKSQPNMRVTPEKAAPFENAQVENQSPESKISVKDLTSDEEGKTPYKNKKGLSTASQRKFNEEDLSVTHEDQDFLQGREIDQSKPVEVQLAKQAANDSPDPEGFKTTLETVQNAIKNGNSITAKYDSAANNIDGIASDSNRESAQKLADKGIIPRVEVEKDINPINLQVRTKEEPIYNEASQGQALEKLKDFDFARKRTYKNANDVLSDLNELYQANAENRAPNIAPNKIKFLLDNFVPTEPKTRMYANNFSFDKFMGNKDLLTRALTDSGLADKPEWKQAIDYMNSPQFEVDAKARLQNVSQGYRGDGQPLNGSRGATPPPLETFTPTQIPDWKIQILNTLEGGPSRTYYKEAGQNMENRGVEIDPTSDTGTSNPFWNKLKDLGKDLVLNEKDVNGEPITTKGIGSMIASASELIRLDRVKGIAEKKIDVPTSDYANRAMGFWPNSNPIIRGIDQTIRPGSLAIPYGLQGLGAAKAYEEVETPFKIK